MTTTGMADAALLVLAAPVAAASAYLLALALLSRRLRAPAVPAPSLRFEIVVPAHDEEGGIAATVRSLLAVDHPEPLRRVRVVADNCTDATAERARAAGAAVLVRTDPRRRGKGYALAHAFERVLAEGWADAVVVVDADSVVSPNLLSAFAARLAAGAPAVQADYGVRNPDASWRTRLMTIALALVHGIRSTARERVGCSAGLRGNGMCFSARLLRDVPYDAFSIVEDLEYGIRIGLAGHRVHYAPEARVLGDMVAGEAASRSQRLRWEGGRLRMARTHALALLGRGLAVRDRVLLDLAADLLLPPLAYLAAAVLAGGLAAVLAGAIAGAPLAARWAFAASLAALAIYVARGWHASGTGLRGLAALLRAPAYLVWKLRLVLAQPARAREVWVRTSREKTP